jgi:hypothetical protein
MIIAMAIEKTGFHAHETGSARQFPKHLQTSDGEGQEICVPDGYTPDDRPLSGEVPDNSLALWNSHERGEGNESAKPSFLKKLAFTMTLGMVGLAILPSAFAASPAGRAEHPAAQQTVIERVVEGPDLQAYRDEAFQMTAKDVIGEIERTSQDLRKLDDSPGQFPDMQSETGSIDGLQGKGEVSVKTPQVITRSRSVSGTMSYDTSTGEPRSISADVMIRIAGNKVTRHIEYSQNGNNRTYSVSTEGVTYRITKGRNATMHETFQQLSAMDVISEVTRAAEDLQSLDDSPEQVLVEQNGKMVPAGSIDKLPGPGEVRIVSPHKLADGRSVSGTYSFDGDTGKPKELRAEVSENSGRYSKNRIVELSENKAVRVHRVSTGSLIFEVQMDRMAEF